MNRDCTALQTIAAPKTPAEHDAANRALGDRFVRALAAEKALLDRSLPTSAPFVLAAIMYHRNEETGRAWPAYGRIQELTGYGTRTIELAISALIEAGYIFTERRAPKPGARALRLYGLCEVRLVDIDAAVTAAVDAIKRQAAEKASKAGTAEFCGPRKAKKQASRDPRTRKFTAGTAEFCIAGTAEYFDRNTSSEPTVSEVILDDDLSVAAHATSSSSNALPISVVGDVPFADSEHASRRELARVGYSTPTEAQINLMRGEIVSCLSKFGPGKGYSTPAEWFRARFVPRLMGAIRKAANETLTTGRKVDDDYARRLAMFGGGQ